MRFVTALLLLVSVLTTHAVALERAAEKALTCTKTTIEVGATPTLTEARALTAASAEPAETAAETPAGPCHGHGECVFLMPQYRLTTSTLVPAEAGERRYHASVHHGRLVNKPPIA
jgi:hypothetical protein